MGMFELAHNSNYKKEGKARYRDYDSDIDARELTRRLLKDYTEGDDSFTCDEEFDDFMLDCLQDGIDSIEGVIALFYRNLWAMADLHEKLKKFEDLEEQGRLLELPCAVGDTMFRTNKCAKNPIISMEVHEINMFYSKTNNFVIQIKCHDDIDGGETFYLTSEIGKIVFLTKSEAERALVEIKEGFK